jgi:hypothetical protein
MNIKHIVLAVFLLIPLKTFAIDFQPTKVRCMQAPVSRILSCGISWSADSKMPMVPESEAVVDLLNSLDWKQYSTYSCDVKLGIFINSSRQVFDLKNCAPEPK